MLTGKRLAIVVGVNEYADQKIPKLPGAENDAREMFERLHDPNIGNFKMYGDRCLVGRDATCHEIRRALSEVFYKTQSYDLVLFYFSGHGFIDVYKEGYIAPYDVSLDEPLLCGIRMNELKDIISVTKFKTNVVMILDCCNSGVATQGDKAVYTLTNFPEKHRGVYEKNFELLGTGRIVFASSRASQRLKRTYRLYAWSSSW